MTQPSREELLACPFCGPGNSMVDPWFDDVSKRWAIGCGRCGASSGRSVHAEGSKEAAIKSWNTRASSAQALPSEPVAWQWRVNATGKEWSSWFHVEGAIENFKRRFGFELKNGTTEIRPLYAALPASSGEVREALQELANLHGLIDDDTNAPDSADFFRHDGYCITYGSIRTAQRALKSSPSLAATLRQRAIDLRRNSSGGDDFDPKAAEFCAGILDSYANDIESGALR